MEFYTAHEVAEILRLSYPTVYKLIKNGDIEAIKVGAHYRVPASAIEKLKSKNLKGYGYGDKICEEIEEIKKKDV